MILVPIILVLTLLTGCASHVAAIASSTNDVRSAVIHARDHLEVVKGNLDQIEVAAANVHEALAYVQETPSAILTSLQYGSVAVVAVVVLAIIYVLKK